MLTIVLFTIPFICAALLFQRGLWRNMILFINVVLAGLLATNYFEPVAEWMKGMQVSFDFMWDFLAWWGTFAAGLLVLRIVTDRLTTQRVRFNRMVDLGGGVFFSVWIGWTMFCFTAASFHVAPLPRDDVQASPDHSNFPLAADRIWLGFMQWQSRSGLGRSPIDGDKHKDDYVFDGDGDFLLRYATSRKKLESNQDLRTLDPKGRGGGK